MNELIEYAQMLIAYLQRKGAALSLESQRAAAEFLKNILHVIEEQSQVTGKGQDINIGADNQPPIDPAGPSSNVEGFAYDDKTGNLMVRFLGEHPNRNGPIYSYSGVPREIFDLFQKGAVPARTNGQNRWGKWWKGKVPSLGASLYTLIKNRGYSYRRLS